tara:strand:+ start:16733 stop:17026 length:294 start_codon:yes stop_codon:yes gene_type:complete
MKTQKTEETYVPKIPYKDIVHLKFKDTRLNKSQYLAVSKRLKNACSAGNLYKTKYKITFQTTTGVLMVETTIWMVGSKYLLVKGNLCIPINSIIKVV